MFKTLVLSALYNLSDDQIESFNCGPVKENLGHHSSSCDWVSSRQLSPEFVSCRAFGRADHGAAAASFMGKRVDGPMTARCRQHDLGPPDKLARSVAIDHQSLKFRTVGGAKVKADVIASHAPNMARQAINENPVSGEEH